MKDGTDRRRFLSILGWGSLAATLAISSGSFVRFLYPRVLFERPATFKIRSHEIMAITDSSGFQIFENWKQEHSVWIVKDRSILYALQAKCTHLGCTPNWFPDEGIFKCPCHGSRFRGDGTNFAGPAPRPLDRLGISMDRDGNIIVDKKRVYTYKDFGKHGAYVKG